MEAFLVSERDGNPQLIRGKETRAENYRLLCAGGSGCILSYGSGESIPLVEDRILGWVVGGISEMSDHFRLGGWVVDKKNLRLVKEVVAFEGERLIASGRTHLLRSDAVKMLKAPYLEESGFLLEFRLDRNQKASLATIRVFGISEEGVAGELYYPQDSKDWPFSPAAGGY